MLSALNEQKEGNEKRIYVRLAVADKKKIL